MFRSPETGSAALQLDLPPLSQTADVRVVKSMAKKSSTQEDPATLAFSAVEDALKDSVFGDSAAEPDYRSDPQPTMQSQQPQQQPRASGSRAERARVADKQAAMPGSVANDDRFQGSRILYGLQSRSNSTPNFVAVVVSIVWVAAMLGIGLIRNGSQIGNSSFWGSNDFVG